MQAMGTQEVTSGYFFLMKILGCHNDVDISTHEYLKRKRINH